MSPRKCTKGGRKPNICRCMLGAVLSWRMFGKAPSEMSALQPYRGKPAVRNDRGDRGNVGIIEARSAPRSYPTAGGACDETHVPTATATRIHHAARRRGGCVAPWSAGAAELSTHWRTDDASGKQPRRPRLGRSVQGRAPEGRLVGESQYPD